MVKKPNFKLIAKGKDITKILAKNLINISFNDKEGFRSDEMSFKIHGIYKKPFFGDILELWLGEEKKLFKCGSFSVQTSEMDYKSFTTEIRATAVDFASQIKNKKIRTWQDSDLFSIAKKISQENNLTLKTAGDNISIISKLQDNVNDLDFLYNLCFENGYLMALKDNALIITSKDGKDAKIGGANITPKNEALPKF